MIPQIRSGFVLSILMQTCLAFFAPVYGQQESWETLIGNGDGALARKHFADAEQNYRRALKLAEKSKDEGPKTAVALIKLAELFSSQSRTDDAEAFADQSISALSKAASGVKSAGGAAGLQEDYYRAETRTLILDKAAAIYFADGKYSKAEQLYAQVIKIRETYAQAKEHPHGNEDFLKFLGQALTGAKAKVADAYGDLARVYFVQGRLGDAQLMYSKALAILQAEFGEDQPPVAKALSNLATAYAAQGLYEKAEPLYVRAVGIFERSNWLDKPEVATAYENYSLLLSKTGRQADATVMLEKARRIRSKVGIPQG